MSGFGQRSYISAMLHPTPTNDIIMIVYLIIVGILYNVYYIITDEVNGNASIGIYMVQGILGFNWNKLFYEVIELIIFDLIYLTKNTLGYICNGNFLWYIDTLL